MGRYHHLLWSGDKMTSFGGGFLECHRRGGVKPGTVVASPLRGGHGSPGIGIKRISPRSGATHAAIAHRTWLIQIRRPPFASSRLRVFASSRLRVFASSRLRVFASSREPLQPKAQRRNKSASTDWRSTLVADSRFVLPRSCWRGRRPSPSGGQ